MATPGSKWTVKKSAIVEALKEKKGRLTYVARHFNVKYETLKKKIDADPELIELVSNLRNDFENTILDMAENCVAVAIGNQKEDPSNALKSAFYVLNSKGKSRGWSNTLISTENTISIVDIQNKDMEIAALREKIAQYESVHNESQAEPKLFGSDAPI